MAKSVGRMTCGLLLLVSLTFFPAAHAGPNAGMDECVGWPGLFATTDVYWLDMWESGEGVVFNQDRGGIEVTTYLPGGNAMGALVLEAAIYCKAQEIIECLLEATFAEDPIRAGDCLGFGR